MLNLRNGIAVFAAIGAFFGLMYGRLAHTFSDSSLLEFVELLVRDAFAGALIASPIGVVFALLPESKWNPVKKAQQEPEEEDRQHNPGA